MLRLQTESVELEVQQDDDDDAGSCFLFLIKKSQRSLDEAKKKRMWQVSRSKSRSITAAT